MSERIARSARLGALRTWRRAQLASRWPHLLTAVGLAVALPVVAIPGLHRPFGDGGHELGVTIVMIAAIGGIFLGLAALTGRRLRELLLAGVAIGLAVAHPGLDFVFGAVGSNPLGLGRSLIGAVAAAEVALLAEPRRGLASTVRTLTVSLAVVSFAVHGAAQFGAIAYLAPAAVLMLALTCVLSGVLAHVRGVVTADGGLLAVGVIATSAGLGTTLQLVHGNNALTVGVATMTLTSVILAGLAALMSFLAALERHDLVRDTHRLARSLELARLTAQSERHAELAHDQRTSLLAIQAAAQRLRDHPSDRLADAVAHEAARLQRMLAGATARRQPFAVEDVVSPVVACMGALHGPIAMEVTGPSRVWGSVDETAEILRALVDNAHEHGRTPVSVRVSARDGTVVVAVRDSGFGVPDVLRDVIFDRGVTSDPSTHSGLGLFAARRLARAAGGDLRRSADDRATFELELPTEPPAESTEGGIPSPAPAHSDAGLGIAHG